MEQHARLPPPVAGAPTGPAARRRFEVAITRVLTGVNNTPPKLVSAVGRFQLDIVPLLPTLNEYFEAVTQNTSRIFTLVERTVKTLLDMCVRNFDEFEKYQNMPNESPWSTVMGIYVIMASLILIMEDRWLTFHPELPVPWKCMESSHSIEYILVNEMCCCDRPIKSYTVSEMVMALRLLGIYWYRLQPCDDLHTYLHALLHRSCILSVHPGGERVHDVEDMREEYTEGEEEGLYQMTNTGIRNFAMQIVRMILIVEFTRSRFAVQDAPLMADKVATVREYMRTNAAILSKTRETRADLTSIFPAMMINHGDAEEFVKQRGIERGRYMSVIMTVKPEVQQAYTHLHQFMILDKLATLTRDEEPDYFDKWTRAEHAYTILLKAYIMNIPLTDEKTNFYSDCLAFEVDIPSQLNKLARNRVEPVVIQLFGRLHVYHRGTVHLCTCVEHAFVMWYHLIVTHHGGVIASAKRSVHDAMIILGLTGKGQAVAAGRGVEQVTKMIGNIVID
jgi:hypothetical protein